MKLNDKLKREYVKTLLLACSAEGVDHQLIVTSLVDNIWDAGRKDAEDRIKNEFRKTMGRPEIYEIDDLIDLAIKVKTK